MTLEMILGKTREFPDGAVIFAVKPWAKNSDAEVGDLDNNFKVPQSLTDRGLDYFLEIGVANEVLEVFGTHKPTNDECCELLIFYAENDAYPDWVYG